MDLETIFEHGGLSLAIVLTLIQIAPININPWSAIGRLVKTLFGALGRALNGELLAELSQIKHVQNEQGERLEITREELTEKLEIARDELKERLNENTRRLDQHIATDSERYANRQRSHILRFNNELLREIPHTKEDFEEILRSIDWYERYCADHVNYENNRCSMAIKTIKDVYFTHLKKHDFFQEGIYGTQSQGH